MKPLSEEQAGPLRAALQRMESALHDSVYKMLMELATHEAFKRIANGVSDEQPKTEFHITMGEIEIKIHGMDELLSQKVSEAVGLIEKHQSQQTGE